MGRVQGKVAIVTGGASGIGEAEARVLAREGANVVVSDINVEAGEQIAKEIGGVFLEHDVASEDAWQSVIASTLDRFGRLDVLINNAGIAVMADIEETSTELWRKMLAVHLDATFFGCKYAIGAMKGSGGGSIVNTSSTAALKGMGLHFAYTAAKGGIRALTKSVACHCKVKGYGIRCNSIHPGGIMTPLLVAAVSVGDQLDADDPVALEKTRLAMGFGEPNDVANFVLFLASEESKHVNGAELVIDDGETVF
jgi:3(or 17)beta-hydroxysteroid dehydrogenase